MRPKGRNSVEIASGLTNMGWAESMPRMNAVQTSAREPNRCDARLPGSGLTVRRVFVSGIAGPARSPGSCAHRSRVVPTGNRRVGGSGSQAGLRPAKSGGQRILDGLFCIKLGRRRRTARRLPITRAFLSSEPDRMDQTVARTDRRTG